MSRIEALAQRQLDAYNASDLDHFAACYSEVVRVFEGEELLFEGREAFTARYQSLFARFEFGAEVEARFVLGDHCVDRERWWRIDPDTKERSEGEILVYYGLEDDTIGLVRFMR